MIPSVDAPAELEHLARSVEALGVLRRALGARVGDPAPGVSGWSVAEHLYHLCLSTDLALRNVSALAAGRGVPEGEPNDLARRVLTEGCYPRGESQAPRMVRPPARLDPALLDQELALLQQALTRTHALLDDVPGAGGRIPHQNLGALDAAQWLRFARLHARHHLAIVEDIAAAIRGKPAPPPA